MSPTILIVLTAAVGLLAAPRVPLAAAEDASPPATVAPPAGSPPALGDLSTVPLVTGFS